MDVGRRVRWGLGRSLRHVANRRRLAIGGAAVVALAVTAAVGAAGPSAGRAAVQRQTQTGAAPAKNADGLGIKPGKIKHVWLIILENKSYDASFTGLNDNTYLWHTLPAQGALLKHYYGTGHYSLDNYISMVSGQATQPDTQADCPYYDAFSGTISKTGSMKTNRSYGQVVSAAGPNAAAGSNGCVYGSSVPTLFDQLDAAHISWKGYAQDLNAAQGDHSAGVRYCGSPYPAAAATGTTTQPNPGSANATDQYVPKHFPFPWFESVLQSGDCDSAHIADVFDPAGGLYRDLQHEATTPAFSWISPNNCSDAHDAVCKGNNLSGGFSDPTTPNPSPRNHTGGLYAADLFLAHVIPEIERSPAFKDGGLIDITFDEAFPPFTYTGNSFANSKLITPNAAASIASDTAGETLFGKTVHTEPTGPNTPLARDASGNEIYPGPGDNAFIDRPADCVVQTVPSQPAGTCILGGGSAIPTARADAGAIAGTGVSTIRDDSAVATDVGRSVSGAGIPDGAFVGHVTDASNAPDIPAGGPADVGLFRLVDANGAVLITTGPVAGVILGARTAASDPLYDATDPTNGGGNTGSVLISPYIRPGTVSKVYYNHYSWLRTMEDLFALGTAARGLDGAGHIGYAAQPGLAPFGADVFTNALRLQH